LVILILGDLPWYIPARRGKSELALQGMFVQGRHTDLPYFPIAIIFSKLYYILIINYRRFLAPLQKKMAERMFNTLSYALMD